MASIEPGVEVKGLKEGNLLGSHPSPGDAKRERETNKIKTPKKMLQVFVASPPPSKRETQAIMDEKPRLNGLLQGIAAEMSYDAIAIPENLDEKAIFEFIEANIKPNVESNKTNTHPLLHIHLTFPETFPKTAMPFSLEGLKAFKMRGGKLVITIVDFSNEFTQENQRQTLEILSLANSLVFLAEEDKLHVLQANTDNKPLHEILMKAQVLNPLPALFQKKQSYQSIGNILFLGDIEETQGLNHLIKLSKLIKKSHSKELALNGRKVMVVGALPSNQESAKAGLLQLMSALYPEKVSEMTDKSVKELMELLAHYKKLEKAYQLIPAIPMEIHLNLTQKEFNELVEGCVFAYFPGAEGVHFKNEHFINAIAHGLVVYSHQTPLTPKCLLSGGEHQGAVILMDSDDFGANKDGDCDFTGYSNVVLEDIIRRSKDYTLTSEIRTCATHFYSSVFSLDIIYHQLAIAYRLALQERNLENTDFLAAQADFFARRSYAKFKGVQGIHVPTQSRVNFRYLVQRLQTVTGPYTEEMRKLLLEQLKEKSKGGESILKTLTADERKIFKIIVRMPWFVKHVTPHFDVIRRNGHRLLSLDQRRRQGESIQEAFTPSTEGQTDNVFMSMNPGADFDTVRFLDSVGTEISANIETLAEENSSALRGAWSSGHLYAFIFEEDSAPVKLFGTEYRVQYRKNVDESSGEEDATKECIFIHPDGRQMTQTFRAQDEIFVYPRIESAIALMTIEKIRFLGKNAWLQIMQLANTAWEQIHKVGFDKMMETEATVLRDLVQVFFHTGAFEVHKPSQFLLDSPGVSIIKRKPKVGFSDEIASNKIKPLIEATLLGDGDKILNALHDNLPLDATIYHENCTINLLAAAILSGHIPLVSELLNRGVEIHNADLQLPKGKDKAGAIHMYPMHILVFVAILANPAIHSKVLKHLLKDKIKGDLKVQHENALIIAELLINQGSKFKRNKNINQPMHINNEEFSDILYYFNPSVSLVKLLLQIYQGKGNELPLVEAVSLKNPELVELFLKQGAEIDEVSDREASTIEKNEFFIGIDQLPESSPLIVAIYLQETEIVQILLNHNVNVNKCYSISPDGLTLEATLIRKDRGCEGHSPLMFAVHHENIEICRMLLEKGADLNYRSPQGHTACSLAKHLGFREEIFKLLLSYIKPKEQYLLHEAAIKSDWEKCKTLILSGENDQLLNAEGRSAYNLNPQLLSQPFIPLARKKEKSLAFKSLIRLILAFRDKPGELYFLIMKCPHSNTQDYQLPFLGILEKHFSPKKILHFCSVNNLARSEKDFTINKIGALAASRSQDTIYFEEDLVVLEFSSEALLTLQKMGNEDYVLIPAAKMLELEHDKEGKAHKELETMYCGISNFTKTLLTLLSRRKDFSPLTEEELAGLNKLYGESRLAEDHLITHAKQGNFGEIEKITEQLGSSMNLPLASLEELPDSTLTGESNPHYGYHHSLFRIAVFSGQMECAYQIAKIAIGFNPFHDLLVKEIIKSGHLGLFDVYCQTLQQEEAQQQGGQSAKQRLAPYVEFIIKHSKIEILMFLYENDFTDKTPEQIIQHAMQCLSVDVVKVMLPYVTEPKQFIQAYVSASVFYKGDVMNDVMQTSRYDHLTPAQRDKRALELLQVVKPDFKDAAGQPNIMIFWLEPALKYENIDLVKELLKHLPALTQMSQIQYQNYLRLLQPMVQRLEKEFKEKQSVLFMLLEKLGQFPECEILLLAFAAEMLMFKDKDVVKDLTERFELLFQRVAPKMLALRNAIQNDDTKTLQEILTSGVHVNTLCFLKSKISITGPLTPLADYKHFAKPTQIALNARRFDCLAVLLENGADLTDLTLLKEDMLEAIKLGNEKLLLALHKKNCPLLSLAIQEFIKFAWLHKQFKVFDVLLHINSTEHTLLNVLPEIMDQTLATGEIDTLDFILPKVTSPLVAFSITRHFFTRMSQFIQDKKIEITGFRWAEEIIDKFEGSGKLYQMGKYLLNRKPENLSSLFPQPSLLLILGLKHEKDLIELFNIVLQTTDCPSKELFFKDCLQHALDTVDLRLVAWLSQNKVLFNLNRTYLAFQPDNVTKPEYCQPIGYFLRSCIRQGACEIMFTVIINIVEALLQAGADPNLSLYYLQNMKPEIKDQKLKNALLEIMYKAQEQQDKLEAEKKGKGDEKEGSPAAEATASPAMLTSFNMASEASLPLLDTEERAKPKLAVDNK